MSNTEKSYFPASLVWTSSGVGISKCSRRIALFSGFGSRQRRNAPLRFSVITKLLSHSVGPSASAMTPFFGVFPATTSNGHVSRTGSCGEPVSPRGFWDLTLSGMAHPDHPTHCQSFADKVP